jgi:hypothetical protein
MIISELGRRWREARGYAPSSDVLRLPALDEAVRRAAQPEVDSNPAGSRLVYDCCEHGAYMCPAGHPKACPWPTCVPGKKLVSAP